MQDVLRSCDSLVVAAWAEVYEAWDTELDETVALKTIRLRIASNIDVIERFKREVEAGTGGLSPEHLPCSRAV